VSAQQHETSAILQHAKSNFPPELVAPVLAFLVHESCPVTGECIDTAGGQVRRIYVAQTEGFTDRDLTPEMLAARWDEVMAGAPASIIPHGAYDISPWGLKPYRPARGTA